MHDTPSAPEASSEKATPMVVLRGVTFGYGSRVIIENIDIEVPRGKVVALMGTSGGGKTTVLRLLGRQIKPIAGQVLFDGQDLAPLNLDQLYAVRRRMGMLFQFGEIGRAHV